MGCEQWIRNVAGIGREDAPGDLARGIGKKLRIVNGLRREERFRRHERQALTDPRVVPSFEADTEFTIAFYHLRSIGLIDAQHQVPALNELRIAALVRGAEELRPVQPIVAAFVSQHDALRRRIRKAHDCAGIRGRPRADLGVLVHIRRAVSPAGELQRGGAADDPGSDDDGLFHARPVSPANQCTARSMTSTIFSTSLRPTTNGGPTSMTW